MSQKIMNGLQTIDRVVHDSDAPALLEQALHQPGTDVAGSAEDQDGARVRLTHLIHSHLSHQNFLHARHHFCGDVRAPALREDASQNRCIRRGHADDDFVHLILCGQLDQLIPGSEHARAADDGTDLSIVIIDKTDQIVGGVCFQLLAEHNSAPAGSVENDALPRLSRISGRFSLQRIKKASQRAYSHRDG